ncbi:4-hydroxy-tetrahydrodipicolinate reductase [Capnocytophaga sp. ARDL2]|uniref:4-hydroxy-tetrahydrodipicolinate reductase n=1 Tax=Capnocytophaga sp. ARDL2 TaxID=3238809 RepID=UPI0035564B61
MKIALLGYGKMGKEIEKIAQERGHSIVLKKNENDSFDGLEQADVAIDFSIPSSAKENITTTIAHNIPVVCGTTGWLEQYDEVVDFVKEKNGGFLYASNFSIGVNIFFELNKYLAQLMAPLKQYNIAMEEIHHTQKLDAPSGTAISLANDIIAQTNYTNWGLDAKEENILPIVAKRIPDVPGTHTIFYESEIDTIEIKHTAHNRKGFALGAVLAAEWMVGKKGVFSMKDVLFSD